MRIRHKYGELYCHKEKGWWYIDSLWVEPEHRNSGIGTSLMNKALSKIGRPVALCACPEMGYERKLKAFYKKFGFEPFKQRKDDPFPCQINMVCMK